MNNLRVQDIKKAVGHYAAEMVENNTIVGLGTGSTVEYFLQRLAERCQQGLKIQGVPTSLQTAKLASALEIPLANLEEITAVDITIDGADEVDSRKNLIKGGGGALLREKIVAAASNSMIVIIDNAKIVEQLGAFGIPLEITPFAWTITLEHIKQLGFDCTLRKSFNGDYVYSDNNNLLAYINSPLVIEAPEKLHQQLINIPGVVETGIFCKLASKIIVGDSSCKVKVID
ncbi:MAG: ribose-5-phosphate isomerase RpiA [Chlamydiota bacterium]